MAFKTDSSDRSAMSEINVTPLVDVMLVLLIVFIVTAPLLTQAVHVDLPKTEKTDASPDQHTSTIAIDKDGKITLNDQAQPMETLEQGLAMLASIGSTAPFVGLFGTVWGIMHALEGISKAKSASLDVVAGPIGEALVATAIGIAAAIPAVLAYNYFLRKMKLCEAELDYFATDFFNLAVKSSLKPTGDK